MPVVRRTNRPSALRWLYNQVHLVLLAFGAALLIVLVMDLPDIHKRAQDAKIERANDFQHLYQFYCIQIGMKTSSPEFERCLGDLEELSKSIVLRMAKDAEF